MKYFLLYCLLLLSINLSRCQNATIELEETITEKTLFELNPGLEKLQAKIIIVQNAFTVKSEYILHDATLNIRKIEETARRHRIDAQRDISEEEKIIIEETRFTDVEFLVKHCSSIKVDATDIMLQNAVGGIRTCVDLGKKKTYLQKIFFEDLHAALGLTQEELGKIEKKCNQNIDNSDARLNCYFEHLYMSNGPVVNLYLRKKEAESGLKKGEEGIQIMKNNLNECSEIVLLNMKEDMKTIIEDFRSCCANVISRTKLLLKLLPVQKEK